MSKRLGLTLSDDTHAQIKDRAAAAGVSVHSWIVTAIERENFRQLCQQANQWWAQHPEADERYAADHARRQSLRSNATQGSGSSAA